MSRGSAWGRNLNDLEGPELERGIGTCGIIHIYCVRVIVELFSGQPKMSSSSPANDGK